MRSLTRLGAIGMFFALALVPLAFFGVNELWHGSGSLELAKQAEFPHKLTPDMFRRISDWFNDRIGLRYFFIKLGSALNVGLLHSSISRDVIIGREGWLFIPTTMTGRPSRWQTREANCGLRCPRSGRLAIIYAALARCSHHVVSPR